MDLPDVLKAVADTNRLRILNLLHGKTLCVCDLEDILDLTQSNLSRHLARLKRAGLASSRKKSLFTYYSRKPLPGAYGPVIDALCDLLSVDPAWKNDRARLARRLKAPRGTC